MRPEINDVVQLIEEIPSELLAINAIGVIVAELGEVGDAYEVEFCDENGRTIAVLALRPNQFVLMHSSF